MLDLILQGVMLVDPEKNTLSIGDLGIAKGKIAAKGEANTLKGKNVFPLKGYAVAPGMIDAHAHVEARPRSGFLSLAQGITTTVGGNCGGGSVNFAQFKEKCKAGFFLHQMEFVGHNALRNALGIERYQKATQEETQKMCSMAHLALSQGAIGISFGLGYAPGYSYEEVSALLQVAGTHSAFASVDTQLDTPDDIGHLCKVMALSQKAGVRLLLSHFVYQYGAQRTLLDQALAAVEQARANGTDVWVDSGLYTWWVSGLGSPLFEKEYVEKMGYHNYVVTTGEHKGQVLDEALYEHTRKEHGHEALLEMSGCEDRVYEILQKPYCIPSSDAGEYKEGEGHPQVAGNFARLIHQTVTEQKLWTLPQAIAKASLLPSQVFGLPQKGRLSIGADADLFVFDVDSYQDRSWFSGLGNAPDTQAQGVKMVLLMGKVAFLDGKYVDNTLGRLFTTKNPSK